MRLVVKIPPQASVIRTLRQSVPLILTLFPILVITPALIGLLYHFQPQLTPTDILSILVIAFQLVGYFSSPLGSLTALCVSMSLILFVPFPPHPPLLLHPEILLLAVTSFCLSLLQLLIHQRGRYTRYHAQHFHQLAQNSLLPIILIDQQGQIIFSSRTIKDIIGFPSKYLKRKNFLFFIHPQDQTKFQQNLDFTLLHPGKKTHIEFRLKTKRNDWRWLKLTLTNYLFHPGINAVVAGLQDITSQKESDRQHKLSLKREQLARRDAEAAVRQRDEFLSIASHELKTPLTTILLHLRGTLKRILTQSVADFSGEKLVDSLKIAADQSQRLSHMIKDLLDISVVATGRIQIDPQPGELSNIVNAAINALHTQIERHRVQVTTDCPQKIYGQWDKIRIEQIITNLLSNALKYGDHQPISISLTSHQNQAIIEVTDQGKGLTPAEQKNLFTLFYRARPNGKTKGLGVGLYISRQIARTHGGELSCQSHTQKGTTFTLTLPIPPPTYPSPPA